MAHLIFCPYFRRKQRARQLLPYADLAVMTVGAVSDNATTPRPPLLLTAPPPPNTLSHLQFDLLFYCFLLPHLSVFPSYICGVQRLLYPAGLRALEQTNGKPGHQQTSPTHFFVRKPVYWNANVRCLMLLSCFKSLLESGFAQCRTGDLLMTHT